MRSAVRQVATRITHLIARLEPVDQLGSRSSLINFWRTVRRSWCVLALFALALVTLPLVASAAQAAPIPVPAAVAGPPCSTDADAVTPVVCIPSDSGEDEAGLLGAGETATFGAQVVNNGPAVTDASVVITLPVSLRVDATDGVVRYEQWWLDEDSPDGTPLPCTVTPDGSVLTCSTGPLAQDANIVVAVDLTASASVVVGSSAAFTIGLQAATGRPEFPATSISGEVEFVGSAHLVVTITPATVRVVVGHSTNLVATVHNVGPDAAPNAVAVAVLGSDDTAANHFVITDSAPLPGDAAAPLNLIRRTAADDDQPLDGQVGFWPIGTIPAGVTASVTVTVKAVSGGTSGIFFAAGADAADPSCDSEDDVDDCTDTALADLVAVAAPVVTPTRTVTVTVAAPSPSAKPVVAGPQLANTGFHAAPWVMAALAAIVLGSGLSYGGRPPRTSPRRAAAGGPRHR